MSAEQYTKLPKWIIEQLYNFFGLTDLKTKDKIIYRKAKVLNAGNIKDFHMYSETGNFRMCFR